MTHRKPARLAIAVILGAGVACGVAYAEMWLKCRTPSSEACVWGHAFLRLTVVVYLIIFGVPTGAVAYWLTRPAKGAP